MRDQGGELKARDLSPGKSTMTAFGPFVRTNGRPLDQIREMAVEAGWINDRGDVTGGESVSSIDDVLDLIDREGRGINDSVKSQGPSEADIIATNKEQETRARDEVSQVMSENGIDPTDHPDIVARAAEIYAGGMMAYDAVEAANRELLSRDYKQAGFEWTKQFGYDNDVLSRQPQESVAVAQETGAGHERPKPKSNLKQKGDDSGRVGQDGGKGREGPATEERAGGRGTDTSTETYTVEPGAEGKPQLVIPGAEKAPDKVLAQRGADKPLKPKAGYFENLSLRPPAHYGAGHAGSLTKKGNYHSDFIFRNGYGNRLA